MFALLLPAFLLAVGVAPAATEPEVIGKIKKVLNDVYGTPVGAKKRTRKFPRYDITFGEFVQTDSGAAMLIKMNDNTELYLGERAELTIDDFVYDPKTGTANALYAFNFGALRFISGGATEGEVSIVTPTAHIGIRGSEALLFVTPDGETFVNVFEGRFSVRSREGREPKTFTVTKDRNISVSKSGKVAKIAVGVAVPEDTKNKQGKMTRFKMDMNMLKQGGRLEKSRREKLSGRFTDDDGGDDREVDDHPDHD